MHQPPDKRRALAYRVMGVPDPAAGLPGGWTVLGRFRPADHAAVVRALSERRLKGILKILDMPGLLWESRQYLNECRYHTFDDFLLEQKYDSPTRREGVGYGQALRRLPPDLAGYLTYLGEKAPPLAAFLQKPLPYSLSQTERQRHTLIVAGSGAGKSVLLNALVHADRRGKPPPTTVLIDPHGDLAADVARSRLLNDRAQLVYFDPTVPGSRCTVNFFDVRAQTQAEKTSGRLADSTIDRIAQIGVGVLEMIAGGEGSMTLNMRTLLYPCLCVLLDRRKGERPYSIADLARFFDDTRNDDLIARGQQSRFLSHREFFAGEPGSEGTGFHARSFRTTKQALATRLQSLLNSQLFCELAIGNGWSSIDLPALLQSRAVLVFAIGKNQVGDEVAVSFGKFLVGMIQAYCMLRPPEARVPVQLYLDEFHNFVSPAVKELFTELRKFGLHLTIAQQYEGQEGNRDIATAIAANTAVKIVGRTADPATSVKMASKVFVEETDVRNLKIGEFFVRAGNAPTCKLQIPDYFVRPEHRLSESEWRQFCAGQQLHSPAGGSTPMPSRAPQRPSQRVEGVARAKSPTEDKTPLRASPEGEKQGEARHASDSPAPGTRSSPAGSEQKPPRRPSHRLPGRD